MRSPISASLAATGNTGWLVLDYKQRPFSVGIDVSADAAAVAATFAYTVQWTPDNPNDITRNNVVSLTRATTVATLTMAQPHGLVVGDNVVTSGTGDANLDGSHDVASVVSPTVLTYAVANSGAANGGNDPKVSLLRVFADPNMTAKTARAYEGVTTPMMAVRLNGTLSAGSLQISAVQGYGRG